MNHKQSWEKLLSPLFDTLLKENIEYCVCGNYENLPFYTDNDVDIWTNDVKKTFEILKDIANSVSIKCYLVNKTSNGYNCFFYSCDSSLGENRIFHIDILKETCWYPFITLVPSKEIKNNRMLYNNIYVANDLIDAVNHFTFSLSHFNKIRDKYKEDIFIQSQNEEFIKLISNSFNQSFANTAKEMIANKEWNKLELFFKQNKNFLLIKKLFFSLKNSIKIFDFLIKNIIRFFKPSGLFIAFIGTDGAGKTTIINSLDDFFKKGFTKNKIKYCYWRPFLFPELKKIIPFKKGKDEIHGRVDRTYIRKAGIIKKSYHFIKLLYYWLDYIFGRFIYQGIRSRGGIVCFDRYWHDLLVYPERFGLSIHPVIISFFGIFVPKPDIIFFLSGDQQEIFSRKKELAVEEINDQLKKYKTITNRYNNVISIDSTNKSIHDTKNEVILNCLKFMSNR